MKKSQMYGHVFIYILTIMVTSFILIYGYNSIKKFQDTTNTASCIKFRNDLKSAISTITSDYGTVKRKDLEICSGYMKICFVETYESFDANNLPISIDPIMKDSLKSGSGRNVFLIDDSTKESFYAGNITVQGDVLCITPQNSRISLRLEGRGNYVALDKWS
jgi:hypothetical protein